MKSRTRTGQLIELHVGDDPSAWESAGFSVVDDAAVLEGVSIRLVGSRGHRGIVAWSLAGIDASIDGLLSVPAPIASEGDVSHQNRVTTIDHVVVETNDFARTIPAFEAAGVELRRTRTFDFGDGERQQSFFWLGSVILELVGRVDAEPGAAPPATFWGLALTSSDLDATTDFLGEHTSPPKPAVQKDRFISTLRTRELDISVPIALMSAHS